MTSRKNRPDMDNAPPSKDDKKKNTSLRLSSQTLKALKIRAIEEDTSVQKLIEHLINAYLDGRITLTTGKNKP